MVVVSDPNDRSDELLLKKKIKRDILELDVNKRKFFKNLKDSLEEVKFQFEMIRKKKRKKTF